MVYPAGVSQDEHLRVLECPRCHNSEFSDDATYCRICGLSLYNTCIGSDFDLSHANPSNARYCETCGARTLFLTEGILPAIELSTDQACADNRNAQELPFDENELPF